MTSSRQKANFFQQNDIQWTARTHESNQVVGHPATRRSGIERAAVGI